MRPIITIVIVSLLMGGIYAYTQFAERVRPQPVEYQPEYSSSRFLIRIDRTFDCVGNPEFGLPSSFLVQFKETEIKNREDVVPSSELIEFELPQVETGKNSVYVEAQLGSGQDALDQFSDVGFSSEIAKLDAMRVQLLRDGNILKEQTFWVQPGLNVISGSLDFEIGDDETSVLND